MATRFSRAVGHTGYDAQARGRLVEGAGHVPVEQGAGGAADPPPEIDFIGRDAEADRVLPHIDRSIAL